MRDLAGDVRDLAGEMRDLAGEMRDLAGDARNLAGDARDLADVMNYIQRSKILFLRRNCNFETSKIDFVPSIGHLEKRIIFF